MKPGYGQSLLLAFIFFLSMGFVERAEAVEACTHPKYMRQYLNQLKGASPFMLGWGGLFGGINTAKQHCRDYRNVRSLSGRCVSLGHGYSACPAKAGQQKIWTWGRGGLGTGLN